MKAFFDPSVSLSLRGRLSNLAVFAMIMLVVVTGAAALDGELNREDVTLLAIVAILWIAMEFGRWPAVILVILAMAAINFFFYSPVNAFGFSTFHDILAFLVALLTALTVTHLVAKASEEAARADASRAETMVLYSVSQSIFAASGEDDLVDRVVGEVATRLDEEIAVLRPEDEVWRTYQSELPVELAAEDRRAAERALNEQRPTGLGTESEPTALATYLPLRSDSRENRHILRFRPRPRSTPHRAVNRLRILDAVAGQLAVAFERAELARARTEAEALARTEQLRTALLSSVSHDFRTPLGTIQGAASSLLLAEDRFSREARHDLLTTIVRSAERLNRYVSNLLHMTSIEAGVLKPNFDWNDLVDILGTALASVKTVLGDRSVVMEAEPELPLLWVDFMLIEQVFINLLENAAKFSPPEARIEIRAHRQGHTVKVTVFNSGVELPPADLEKMFERFQRGSRSDSTQGTGLGLSICRGFLAAHGAQIAAERDPQRQGLAFHVTFPVREGPPPEETIDD